MEQITDILIVEDRAAQAEQLSHYLTAGGYRVTIARNGQEARAYAQRKKSSLVITDIHAETQQILDLLAEDELRKAKDELASADRALESEFVLRERAQKVERETQARFRYLFAHNPLPMWVYDVTSHRFLEVNDAAALHYGYSF